MLIMAKRFSLLVVMAAVIATLTAQVVKSDGAVTLPGSPVNSENDSLRVQRNDSAISVDNNTRNLPLTYDEQIRVLNARYKATHPVNDVKTLTAPEFSFALPVPGLIASWDGGGVFGNTSMYSLPGFMGVESGRIGVYQNLGRFSLTAYGAAEKYGYLNGLDRTVGFGGSLSYQASDRISFTIFGSYYSPIRSAGGAQAGYMSIPSFGAYMDYRFSDHWGVQVGAQSYRSSATGEWHPQPILKPYYQINKDTKIGMDVGGILYNLLYYNKNRSVRRMQNPTIPIPRMGDLPVGPRE